MIPGIGLLAGPHVLTRVFQLLFPQEERRQNVFVAILTAITIVLPCLSLPAFSYAGRPLIFFLILIVEYIYAK